MTWLFFDFSRTCLVDVTAAAIILLALITAAWVDDDDIFLGVGLYY